MDGLNGSNGPPWLFAAREAIEGALAEYQTFDSQLSGENPDKGQTRVGPQPHDLVEAARSVAAAMRQINHFHGLMMLARRGWDKSQVDRMRAVEDLHHAVLGNIVESICPRQLSRWSDEELAGAMPSVDPCSPVNFNDPFRYGLMMAPARIEKIADAFAGDVLRGTRPTKNRRDRFIGRLADIWREMDQTEPKAGSKSDASPWPFERFVWAVWDLTHEARPNGRLIKAAVERWDTISAQNAAEI